jgi:hypothetical protein
MKLHRALTFAFVFSLPGSAWAVDGVVDINQARALAGGVSPGDAAGFPVTISQAGSYRLTGNLTVPDADTTAISITADNVSVDLNGFTIQGPVACIGQPVTSCSPGGSGIGIDGGGHSALTVRNGVIRGMGGAGAVLAVASRFENVTAESNGSHGISGVPSGSPGPKATTVIGCIASRNGGVGISVTGGVHDSSAAFNSSTGIDAETVTGGVAEANGGPGIVAFSVTGSNANNNVGHGIVALGTAANSATLGNGGRGIAGGVATGCFASGNGTSPQILTTGITGQNICGAAPCP